MISPRTAILTLVATGCISAAGLGSYIAVRNGAASPFAAPSRDVGVSAPAALAEQAAHQPLTLSPETATITRKPQGTSSRPVPNSAQTTTSIIATQPGDAEPSRAEVAPAPQETSTEQVAQNAREEEPAPAEQARPLFDELIIPAESVMGIRLESPVSSETARIEDRVTARVSRDVTVAGQTAVRAGSRLEGVVTLVERGGKFRERARVGIRFSTLVLADNARLPIQTEVILRTGDAPGNEATAKVGGAAVVGTILGSVFGGKKGAAIGSAAGAAGGAAAVAAGSRNAAVIPADSSLTVRLTEPLMVEVPRESTR